MTNEEKVVIALDNQANDPRITNVQNMANESINNISQTYDDMIVNAEGYYKGLSDNIQKWEADQKEIQEKQGQLSVQKLENQLDQAETDYHSEQSAAFADFKKQTQKHGVNAEQMAAQGFAGSGYSESAQVSMYNTYQNRVATARAAFEQTKANYAISIEEAKLQNNAALAEIAYTSLQKQLELSLEGFQYKNTLLTEKTNQITNAKSVAWGQYMDVLDQINKENTLKQSAEQFDAELKWKAEQADIERRHENEQAILERNHDFKILEQQKANEIAILAEKLKNDKELTAYEQSLYEALIDPDGTGGTGAGGDDNKTIEPNPGKYGNPNIKGEGNRGSGVVENETVDDFIMVDGLGYMTWSQLEKKISDGEVKKVTKNGKTEYVFNGEELDPARFETNYLRSLIGNGYVVERWEDGKMKYYWTKEGKQYRDSM